MTDHPLLAVLLNASVGTFPPADGQVIHLPPLPNGHQAVLSLTGRAYLATTAPIPGLDGFGSALHPAVLHRIARPAGGNGTIDVTLATTGRGGGDLPVLAGHDNHPRVRHARTLREQVRVHGDHRRLVTIAHGLAGRTELSVEAAIPGTGPALTDAALRLVPAGQPVFAAVAPGNARSLRAFLARGFLPLGSEVIITAHTVSHQQPVEPRRAST